ncbi:Hok/Gef family protein [Escherichia coli]|uniref:Hok/Gef family protein n=1 Tax=Escherichia coli TaxID=562 RepID=UPI003CCC7870
MLHLHSAISPYLSGGNCNISVNLHSAVSQKPLKTTVICITVVLIIWFTHRSLCEFRFRIAPF